MTPSDFFDPTSHLSPEASDCSPLESKKAVGISFLKDSPSCMQGYIPVLGLLNGTLKILAFILNHQQSFHQNLHDLTLHACSSEEQPISRSPSPSARHEEIVDRL